ncbi:hypothetical protein [Candidatus Coxiella mudrowiae]|uniref:hypothetical protein n=1 Tax=Candidatus Coxiella mudrowiae TaxID=2054173 RepID=UPI00246819DA|nr:hypothetical protein [Candidatus Coxiella mudrowiae]
MIVIGIITLFPRRWLGFTLGIIFTSLIVVALIIDSVTFGLYQMHPQCGMVYFLSRCFIRSNFIITIEANFIS